MSQSAFVTISSLLPQLKLRLADPNIDGMLPDLAEMVTLVEQQVGISYGNTPIKRIKLDVVGHKAKLPADFYSIADINENIVSRVTLQQNVPDFLTIDAFYNTYWTNNYDKALWEDYVQEGCYLRCPQIGGLIWLRYFALPVDSDGIPMIKKGHEEVFMSYVTAIRAQTRYMVKEIQKYEQTQAWAEFEKQCGYARAKDGNPSRKRLAAAAQINNNPYKYTSYGRRTWGNDNTNSW